MNNKEAMKMQPYFLWLLEVQGPSPGGQKGVLGWTETFARQTQSPQGPPLSCCITGFERPRLLFETGVAFEILFGTHLSWNFSKVLLAAPSCWSHSHLQSDTTIPLCSLPRRVNSGNADSALKKSNKWSLKRFSKR